MRWIDDSYAETLHINHRGDRVRALQNALNALIKAGLDDDGLFGGKTKAAVKKYQKSRDGLQIDGEVGPVTAARMDAELDPLKKDHLIVAPDEKPMPQYTPSQEDLPLVVKGRGKKQQLHAFFGTFSAGTWNRQYLTKITLDGRAFRNGRDRKTYVNKKIAGAVLKSISEMVEAGLKFKSYDGCLNKRPIRGGSRWSTHSWAIALDFDAATNPIGRKPKMDMRIVEIWERNGFFWGGRWKRRPDGMHFQAVRGY